MKSKLRQMEDMVISITNLDAVKKLLIEEIKQSILSPRDRLKLAMNIATCQTNLQLQTLFYNSLLKFEGLGVIKS